MGEFRKGDHKRVGAEAKGDPGGRECLEPSTRGRRKNESGGGVAYGPWDELGLRDAGLEVPKSHISVQSSGIWGAL